MKILREGNYAPIKAWVDHVPFEEEAQKQLIKLSSMPFLHKHIAVMPDVHSGCGSCVGTVFATHKAIIPAAVGVDIGCGMMAIKTNLKASQLPDNLKEWRLAIEKGVPHGFSTKRTGIGDWLDIPDMVHIFWNRFLKRQFEELCEITPRLKNSNNINHLGTLGSGNHFIELCIDEEQFVWCMLHSGSRGVGNLIGRIYIEKAKKEMERYYIHLPDDDLAYLPEGSEHYGNYIKAVNWAQEYARLNRQLIWVHTLDAIKQFLPEDFFVTGEVVECHHNYINREHHFDKNVWVTRKGAVSAKEGQYGIIPGSMGDRSFIVRGLGNPESFHSCSHGAGRIMSRNKAKELINLDEHKLRTQGVECRNDASTLDETPGAYKDIDDVMKSQEDLVEIVHTLKQVLCVKG